MTIPSITPGAATAAPANPATAGTNDAGKIEKAAGQFEAMLVRQVLAETFKPTSATGGPPAPGADIYQSFVTDIVADHISQGGALGISHLLQTQLQPPKSPVSPRAGRAIL